MQNQHWFLRSRFVEVTNIVTAGLCFAALFGTGTALITRVILVTKAGRVW